MASARDGRGRNIRIVGEIKQQVLMSITREEVVAE
jgi:hypothetical protein